MKYIHIHVFYSTILRVVDSAGLILDKIGLSIRRVRIAGGLSQNQLVFETGLTSEFINKLEAGKLNISITDLYKIAIVLNVPLSGFVQIDEIHWIFSGTIGNYLTK